jgi:hypothetical protein
MVSRRAELYQPATSIRTDDFLILGRWRNFLIFSSGIFPCVFSLVDALLPQSRDLAFKLGLRLERSFVDYLALFDDFADVVDGEMVG